MDIIGVSVSYGKEITTAVISTVTHSLYTQYRNCAQNSDVDHTEPTSNLPDRLQLFG